MVLNRKGFINQKEQESITEYDYSMTVKETIGVAIVLVGGLLIFFGIQFLSSWGYVGGTTFLLSYVGALLILIGTGLIVWFVATKLK